MSQPLLLLLLCPIALQAQTAATRREPALAAQNAPKAEVQTSKIETFKAQHGKMIVTESKLVAKVPGLSLTVEVRAVALWESGRESQKVKGVEFTPHGRGEFPSIRVDLEDVAEIAKACKMLQELSEKWKDEVALGAEYHHRSGLSLSIDRMGDNGPLTAFLFFYGAIVQLPVASLPLIAQALDDVPRFY